MRISLVISKWKSCPRLVLLIIAFICFHTEIHAEDGGVSESHQVVLNESKGQAEEAAKSFYRYKSVPLTSENQPFLESLAVEEGIKAGITKAREQGHLLNESEIESLKKSAQDAVQTLKGR
jgi:hypothetical protein